jgi:small neutral amino acid transporter SnatA (MarC family)
MAVEHEGDAAGVERGVGGVSAPRPGTETSAFAGVVLVILAIDWLAMLHAQAIPRWFGTGLPILAVVLGVMLGSLAKLGVLALNAG